MFLFFNISGGEILVILLIVLLFFGSKGIPDMARTLGRIMRQIRDAGQDVQNEIQRGANDVRSTVERSMERPVPPAPRKDPEPPESTGE